METVKTYNLTVVSNNQAALLRAIGSIVETGATVTINKVASAPVEEEVGVRKYVVVGDVKGVDIIINTVDAEKYQQLKTDIKEAVEETKKVCKNPAAFFVTEMVNTDAKYVYYVAIRPTTEEEVNAANDFLSKANELASAHPGILSLSPIFNL